MLDQYLKQISDRGDATGRNGGLLDLLDWCDKDRLWDVTIEEARAFLEQGLATETKPFTNRIKEN